MGARPSGPPTGCGRGGCALRPVRWVGRGSGGWGGGAGALGGGGPGGGVIPPQPSPCRYAMGREQLAGPVAMGVQPESQHAIGSSPAAGEIEWGVFGGKESRPTKRETGCIRWRRGCTRSLLYPLFRVPPAGFEPAACGLEDRRSIP